MKVISFFFVIYVLATTNASRTASSSGALVSIKGFIDSDDTPMRKTTQLSQLLSKAILVTNNNTNSTAPATYPTRPNTTSSNTTSRGNYTSNSTSGGNSSAINRTQAGPAFKKNKRTSDSKFNFFCGMSLLFIALLI